LAGQNLFAADTEPMGQLVVSFRLRNRIVHPKLGKKAILGEQRMSDFAPSAAADCLIAAARALRIIGDALPPEPSFGVIAANTVLKHASDFALVLATVDGRSAGEPQTILSLLVKPPDQS
jgi:hypothetical protein